MSAEPAPPTKLKAAPCRYFGTTHAWCDGRVHVPMPLHLQERRKLPRLPGDSDAVLDTTLFARYAQTLAAIPDSEPITDPNEFAFWKRVLRSPSSAASPPAPSPRHEGVPSGSVVCPHDPMCARMDDCRDRTLAEARAERQRKSG